MRVVGLGKTYIDYLQGAWSSQQVEFLTEELSTCSRSANLASKMYRAGNTIAAERSIADAEKCYAMVLRFLSDPKDSRNLTSEESQKIEAELERLRERVDRLQRFRKLGNFDVLHDPSRRR
jgi:hypothetical protein